jgi:AraC-like DNA-binding protein
MIQILDILNYITIFQLSLFCIIFLTRKQGNKLSNKLLALLCFSYALLLSTYFSNFRFRDFFLDHAPHLLRTFEPFSFCISPLLYLYTLSLVRNSFKLRFKHTLLFVPFIIHTYLILSIYTFQSPDEIRRRVIQDVWLGFFTIPGFYVEMVLFGIIRTMNLFFAAISLAELFRYKKLLKHPLSDHARFEFKWQLIILSGISVVFIFDAMKYVYYFLNYSYFQVHNAIYFILFFIFNSLIYSGMKNSILFDPKEVNIKYSKSLLMIDQKELLMKMIIKCMVEDKYYLQPSITVQDMADKMHTQPRYISQVINELTGQNFINFINTYRVEEAKKLLRDPKFSDYSFIGISNEAGFNSKTAFNLAFKKYTGLTPKEFQKMNKKS